VGAAGIDGQRSPGRDERTGPLFTDLMLRAAGTAAASALAVLALAMPSAALGAAPPTWGPLAERIAAPWPDLQSADGTYQDYVYGGGVSFCLVRSCAPGLGNARYAESVNGYALLLTGVRTGQGALIDTALRSLTYVADHPELRDTLQTNFETWSMASSYNLARTRIPARPLFRKNRARWERWLKGVKPLELTAKPRRRYFNHHLVEAVATFELERTGLRSKVKGAVLNPSVAKTIRKRAVRIVEEEVHSVARATAIESGGRVAAVLSDRPEYPVPYQGLSMAFYARALELLGDRASNRSRELLRRMAHASWLLTGPDGDLAYTGRSQEESWALSTTAYGAEVAARLAGTTSTESARWSALAERAVERLRTAYEVGPTGLWIVPALARDAKRGMAGVDPYAGAAIFSGLTLAQLEWALSEAGRPRRGGTGALAADADGAFQVNRADDAQIDMRSGSLWFVVRQSRDFQRRYDDLRNDFGLVALKRRIDGRWRDVMPLRPRVESAERFRADSAGPLLRPPGTDVFGVPTGTRIKASAKAVTVTGGWRMPDKSVIADGTRFVFEPVECGVRLRFAVPAGQAVEYGAFMAGDPEAVTVDGARVTDGFQTVSFSEAPTGVALEGGYASGADPALTRARATFAAGDARRLEVTTCGG
jgi:hypothetical protein